VDAVLNLGQLRLGLDRQTRDRSTAMPAGGDEIGDLLQGEAEPLRGLDHQWAVNASTGRTRWPHRLGQQATPLVIAQDLHVDPSRGRDLAAAQTGRRRAAITIAPWSWSESSTAT
jgi:hypothetical protein